MEELVTNILIDTFSTNPSVLVLVDGPGDSPRRMRRLCKYVYEKAQLNKAIHISPNKKGIAIMYRQDKLKTSAKVLWYEFLFALTLPIPRIRQTLKRQAYIAKQRPADKKFYYFWFLGVQKDGDRAGFELMKETFKTAEKEGLPIYCETTIPRNKQAYERYGFETYKEWYDDYTKLTFYFLRRPSAKS
jgi:hypothetical protein